MDSERNDENTVISFLKNDVKKFVEDREWASYHTPKNLIQALQIEAAELSELLLFKEFTKDDIIHNEDLLNKISNEMADVLIYLISLSNCLNVDLAQSFIKKMEMNKNKYSTQEFNNGLYYKK
jgi:NTP pyrophosphatase (non-canonical NTP hydrolase)